MKHKCDTDPKKMTIKMGGLLCSKCRTILFYPGEKEYKEEFYRRRAEREKLEGPDDK